MTNDIIITVNECNEKRYIKMSKNENIERREQLEVLFTKCKRLLSFVKTKRFLNMYCNKLMDFSSRVKQAIQMSDDDVSSLVDEFYTIENQVKRSSRSFRNLSDIY